MSFGKTNGNGSENTTALLPILVCIECGQPGLQMEHGRGDWPTFKVDLSDRHLRCGGCQAAYPISADDIPIMWTPQVREYLLAQDKSSSTVAANAATYDDISDDYGEYTRQSESLFARLRFGAQFLLRQVPLQPDGSGVRRHLDFGCGPGNVLRAIASKDLMQVGLDVSLQNLRNTRRATGARVVLGDATKMPFADGTFSLVTESSVLHHIEQWRLAVNEACRVSHGGVFLDSEPSRDQLDWSRPARAIFDMRWPVYKLLSYVDRTKYPFRDVEKAKFNYWSAEIHNQPGKGFDLEQIDQVFAANGFAARIVCSPGADLEPNPVFAWKHYLLHLLSLHDPRDPKYGSFSVLASPRPS